MRRVELEIPGLPKRFNQGQGASWRARYGEAQKWLKWVGLALGAQRPEKPFKKALVTLTRVSSVEADFDGLVQSFKSVVDALKRLGVIEDDSPRHIRRTYLHEKGKRGEGKIKVLVVEVDNFPA